MMDDDAVRAGERVGEGGGGQRFEPQPVTPAQARLAKLALLVNEHGEPLYGVSIMRSLGEDAATDLLYRVVGVALTAQRLQIESETMDAQKREQFEQHLATINTDADEAQRLLFTPQQVFVPGKTVQVTMTPAGAFIINNLSETRAFTITDSFRQYYERDRRRRGK